MCDESTPTERLPLPPKREDRKIPEDDIFLNKDYLSSDTDASLQNEETLYSTIDELKREVDRCKYCRYCVPNGNFHSFTLFAQCRTNL